MGRIKNVFKALLGESSEKKQDNRGKSPASLAALQRINDARRNNQTVGGNQQHLEYRRADGQVDAARGSQSANDGKEDSGIMGRSQNGRSGGISGLDDMLKYEELRKRIRENDVPTTSPNNEILAELRAIREHFEVEEDVDEGDDPMDRLIDIFMSARNNPQPEKSRELTWEDWERAPSSPRAHPTPTPVITIQANDDRMKGVVAELEKSHPQHLAEVRSGKYTREQAVGFMMGKGMKHDDALALYEEVMHGKETN